jgi:hypothetical protein
MGFPFNGHLFIFLDSIFDLPIIDIFSLYYGFSAELEEVEDRVGGLGDSNRGYVSEFLLSANSANNLAG